MQYWNRADIPQPPDTWKQQESRLRSNAYSRHGSEPGPCNKANSFLFVCFYTGAKQESNGISKYEKLNLDIGIVVSVLRNNCKEAMNLGINEAPSESSWGSSVCWWHFSWWNAKVEVHERRNPTSFTSKNFCSGKNTVERRWVTGWKKMLVEGLSEQRLTQNTQRALFPLLIPSTRGLVPTHR